MQFRQAVGPVGGGDKSGGGGASNFNPSMEASEPLDDRIPCQFCGRKFNEKAHERHVPHCESKHKANLMKAGPPKAKRGPSVGRKW